MKNRIIYLLFPFIVACSTQKIIQKPIIFDQERKDLSLKYLKEHYDISTDSPTITPKMIVLHWTTIPSLEESFKAFYPAALPTGTRSDIKHTSSLNVSAHFLVDLDGTIYQLLPENMMGRHVIGLNHCAIGIENVGGINNTPLTNQQVKANIWLIKYLAKKYPIEYLIGHYEYTLFENHELWLEKNKSYRTVKEDPGKSFLEKVKKGVAKLPLKYAKE